MLTQKQWKLQHLAQHMSNVAVSAAAEAGRRAAERQSMVKEHGIVAEEMRKLTDKMIELVEQNIYGKLSDDDFDKMMKDIITMSTFLALNAALVACKVLEHKPMAVFAEEIRNLTVELGELYGQEQQYLDMPSVSPRSRVVRGAFFLLRTISGGIVWCENAQFVNEIMLYVPDFIENNHLVINNEWRNMNIPVIKMGDVSQNAGLIIITSDVDSNKQYAVLAEITINILSNSHVGISTQSKSNIPVRECWTTSDGSEMIFPDWEKLANMG